ncbi:MAG: DJ-1/PfpI family protein [Spirochaetales bacterium]|nr:DJ-1/PfpI family protein [Spirochaetales bacterium]
MEKSAIVLFAPGFEEVEAITPVDYLRRAGVKVRVLGVGSDPDGTVVGSRGVTVKTEGSIESYTGTPDCVVLPGGMPGAQNLADSPEVGALIARVKEAGGLIGAICAAPAVVLGPQGLLKDQLFTCYPGFESRVTEGAWKEDRVVVSGRLVTSRGAGTAGEFAYTLIEELFGTRVADDLKGSVLLRA